MNRLVLTLLAILAVAGCSRGGARTREPERPVPVRVAAVSTDSLIVPVVATGTLGPKEDIALSFKIGGVVSRVLVDEGEKVGRGDLLASLDLGEIDPQVARARAAAEKAERDLARASRLYADSVATLEQVQDAETARDASTAELEAATFNRSHAVIVAPSDGVILRRRVEPGETVQAGTPVLVLGSRSRGQVMRVGLADRDVVRVHEGDPATVRFDALPDRVFSGSVREIAAAADPMTGTYRVEIALTSAPSLASGLVGAVEIRPAAGEPVTFVPAESVLEMDGTRGVVYALESDRHHARRKAVTVACFVGDRIAVADGLDGVTTVVSDGAAYLDDGGAVEVMP